MPFTIRLAASSDKAALLSLEDKCFTGDKISPRQMHYLLNKAKATTWLAEDKNTVVGYGMCLMPVANNVARLYSLAVLPTQQGKGIARALLTSMELYLINKNYQCWNLEVSVANQQAIALYTQLGFVTKKTIAAYYDDGSDALKMQKLIKT